MQKKIVHLATEDGDDDDEEEKKDQEKAVDESEDGEGHRVEEYKEEKAEDKVESVDTGTEAGKLVQSRYIYSVMALRCRTTRGLMNVDVNITTFRKCCFFPGPAKYQSICCT